MSKQIEYIIIGDSDEEDEHKVENKIDREIEEGEVDRTFNPKKLLEKRGLSDGDENDTPKKHRTWKGKEKETEKDKEKEKKEQFFPLLPISLLSTTLSSSSFTPSPTGSKFLDFNELDIVNSSLLSMSTCKPQVLLLTKQKLKKRVSIIDQAIESAIQKEGSSYHQSSLADSGVQLEEIEREERIQFRKAVTADPACFGMFLTEARMIFGPDTADIDFYKVLNQLTEGTERYQSSDFVARCGMIGEAFVYLVLCRFFGRNNVIWANKDGESFKPFDIKLQGKYAIEVKTTTSDKTYFPFSFNEAACAQALGENFWIARVYFAMDKQKIKFKCLRNPCESHKNGNIKLFMSI